MRVKFRVSIASDRWSYDPGKVYDMPDERALQWIHTGHADAVREEASDETAVAGQAAERAVMQSRRK